MLASVMEALGMSRASLGRALGVSETLARGLADGSRPLTVERLVEAGRVGAAVLRMAADLAAPVPRSHASPEKHAMAIARVSGWLAECVEGGDVAAMRRAALQGREAYEALLADLEVE
jgi:hypothetical protein